MEFAGFHVQHQFQKESSDQCITPATPQEHKPSTSQSWIPSNIYNNGFLTESFTNSREVGGHKYAMIDSLRISTEQAFGLHDEKNLTQHPASYLLLPRIKGESEIMQSSSSSKAMDESREPQCSPSFLSSPCVTGTEYLPIEGGMTINFGGVSISNLPTPDMTPSLVSCSLCLNSQMLNLHTSYSGSGGIQLRYDTFGLNEETISLSHGNMQHAHGCKNSPSNSSSKISSFASEVTMTKRPSNCSRPKECEAKAKKSRPSCQPLNVRKEKSGDRIQTLQRLVAPFGKTSTAWVLSEAIGYIHFLHDQIQTLSISYMKSVQSKPPRMVQLDSRNLDSREFKPDLRSRGLCLVPVSYASFIDRCA